MPHFKYCLSCWVHSGIGREIILALKYRNADFLKNDIVKLLEDNCKEACELIQNSILVPVPMHYFRRVQRGYNQARVICDAILKIAGGSKIVDMLSSRHKKPQTSLGAKERLLNIKNVFECAAVSRSIPKDSKIVLVDDVFTTGATARECCRVLHTNGFENLYVLTLSRG
jgi:ComF family protein